MSRLAARAPMISACRKCPTRSSRAAGSASWSAQQAISAKKLAAKVGKRLEAIVDEGGAPTAKGRTKGDAPGIDGAVHIATRRPLRAGDIVSVKIERADAYDLWGSRPQARCGYSSDFILRRSHVSESLEGCRRAGTSFETPAARAPQDEGGSAIDCLAACALPRRETRDDRDHLPVEAVEAVVREGFAGVALAVPPSSQTTRALPPAQSRNGATPSGEVLRHSSWR